MVTHLIFLRLIVVILDRQVEITIERKQGLRAGLVAGRSSSMSS
jgi:hypothetical protein